MFVKVLIENTTFDEQFAFEHGMSLYIETEYRKILFDFGASGLFLENARKLGIDLRNVDSAVLSHGHYDHGGGLEAFLKINDRAKVYMRHDAFGNHYSVHQGDTAKQIGLDQNLSRHERIVFLDEDYSSDLGFILYANVWGRALYPAANNNLFIEKEGSFEPDGFTHEQNLVVTHGNNIVLFSGCAHNGIVNILEHYRGQNNRFPTHVIGGFHLFSHSSGTSESPKSVKEVGKYLDNTNAMFYTGHCTGIESYLLLKEILGDRIKQISAGTRIDIEERIYTDC